ncbi:hypothetical protein [Actinoplanes philippinensis]|uniref:hypothetical protein n=1 Tax=Actinoplanes philippinensis TaxID=35752 RepID=UPI003404CB5C
MVLTSLEQGRGHRLDVAARWSPHLSGSGWFAFRAAAGHFPIGDFTLRRAPQS